MNWIRLYNESTTDSEKLTLPVTLTVREVKLIQNYLNKGTSLNEPENKDCQEVVLGLLSSIVEQSDIENLDILVANFLSEEFGIEIDIDPYGENTKIELNGNGLIEIKDCNSELFEQGGKYADKIEGGFWDGSGLLTNGFISIENLNTALLDVDLKDWSIKSIQLKKDGKSAKILLDI